MLQATLIGPLSRQEHPAVPVTLDELVADARRCVAAGAQSFHIHPRDADGLERLSASVIDPVVRAVRQATGVPVGVSTGAWIEPDLERRASLVRAWTAPDYASVNLSEDGAALIMQTLIDAGIGVEAGVWTVEDVDRLADSGLAAAVLRVLVEPVDLAAATAVAFVDEIHEDLRRHRIGAPVLQHGDGEATWVLVADAIERGVDTRIGLEDTFFLADGTPAGGNEVLVRAAAAMVRAPRD